MVQLRLLRWRSAVRKEGISKFGGDVGGRVSDAGGVNEKDKEKSWMMVVEVRE